MEHIDGSFDTAISSWNGPEGFYGPSIGASFPGNDYGLIRNGGGLGQPGNVTLYNGSFQDITAAGNPTPGMQVCKSGSTTAVKPGDSGGAFSPAPPRSASPPVWAAASATSSR